MGEKGFEYHFDGEHHTCQLVPPSVVLYVTATPQPTMIRLVDAGMDVSPDHFVKLHHFNNYVSKRDYRPLTDEDGTDVYLEDGDIGCYNTFVHSVKSRLWVEDLAATPNGVGVYIANSRGECSPLLAGILVVSCLRQLHLSLLFGLHFLQDGIGGLLLGVH